LYLFANDISNRLTNNAVTLVHIRILPLFAGKNDVSYGFAARQAADVRGKNTVSAALH
jgi:hypothetical protein